MKFYEGYLKTKHLSMAEYLPRLFSSDLKAILEGMDSRELMDVFDIPSTMKVEIT